MEKNRFINLILKTNIFGEFLVLIQTLNKLFMQTLNPQILETKYIFRKIDEEFCLMKFLEIRRD